MSRFVVSVGVGKWYPRGIERLYASLDAVGDQAPRALWTSVLPPGSASHDVLPYGFKVAAIAEAKRRGADSVLWLDASCWAIRSLEPVWQHIEEHGHLLIDCANYLSQWSSDRSLAALGFQREREFKVPLVMGGMFGVNFRSTLGAYFFQRMQQLSVPEVLCGDWKNDRGQVSSDKRVRGHRHDQVLMGHIAHEMRLPLVKQPNLFAYDGGQVESTVVVARGM